MDTNIVTQILTVVILISCDVVYTQSFADVCLTLENCRCYLNEVVCTDLTDLETLGVINSTLTHNVTKLTIEDISRKDILCASTDSSNKHCNGTGVVRMPILTAFNNISELTISNTNLTYISDEFFRSFNELSRLTVSGNNQLEVLPFPLVAKQWTDRTMKSISYINNCVAKRVRGNNKVLFRLQRWVLDEEGCSTDTQNITLRIKSIKVVPDNLDFVINLKRLSSIYLDTPYTDSSQTINSMSAEFSGYGYKNVHLNFNHTLGKVRNFYFKFNSNNSDSRNFLKTIPKRFFQESKGTYIANDESGKTKKYALGNDIYTFENTAEVHSFENVHHKHKEVLPRSDMDILKQRSLKYHDMIKRKGDGTFFKPLTLDCGIYDLGNLRNLVQNSDEEKFYEVNTLILFLGKDEDLGRKFHGKITIRYQKLIMASDAKLSYFKYEPKETVNQTLESPGTIAFHAINKFATNGNPTLWENVNIDFVYRIILIAIDVVKPGVHSYVSPGLQKIKRLIAANLLESINPIDVKKYEQKKDKLHYIEHAINKIPELLLFINTEGIAERRLPMISPLLFRKKTLVLQNVAKSLFKLSQLSSFTYARRDLLDIAKIRSQELMKIEEEQRNDMITKVDSSYDAFQQLRKIRMDLEIQLKRNKTSLNATAAEQHPEVEATFVVMEMLLKSRFKHRTFFIQPLTVLASRLHNATIAVKSISKLIKKLTQLVSVINFKMYALKINSADNSTSFLNDTDSDGTADNRGSKKSLDEKFSVTDVLEVIKKIGTIHSTKLRKWDDIKLTVQSMADKLSLPMFMKYLSALQAFIKVGKAETEALFELAQMHADIFITEYKVHAYKKEISFIQKEERSLSMKLKKIKEKELESKVKKVIVLEMKQLRIDVFLHLTDYCRLSFYQTLQPCLAYNQFQIDINLRQIMQLNDWMNKDHVMDTAMALQPPPQTFRDVSISYNFDPRCDKIYEIERETKNKTKQFFLFSRLTKPMKHQNLKVAFKSFFKLYKECMDSPVAIFKQYHVNTFEVSLDDPVFRSFDRVRVDDIQVYLHGAETTSNTVQVSIANKGVVMDRSGDSQYHFTGERWQRIFRYRYQKKIVMVGKEKKTILSYLDESCPHMFFKRLIEEVSLPYRWYIEEVSLAYLSNNSNELIPKYDNNLVIYQEIGMFLPMLTPSFTLICPLSKVKADVNSKFEETYKLPTPFTTWYISVSKEDNPGLNLSQLYSIQIRFSGNMMIGSKPNVAKKHFLERLMKQTSNGKYIDKKSMINS